MKSKTIALNRLGTLSDGSKIDFQTLISNALNNGTLSPTHAKRIQNECFALLASQAGQYTRGQSSSLPVDTAQQLLGSISYTLSFALEQEKSADEALAALTAQPLPILFKQGQQIIEALHTEASSLYEQVKRTRISTANLAYNDTLNLGIAAFFTSYDINFSAQDTPAVIDYPLSKSPADTKGVRYMHQYLKHLYYENTFCRHFQDIDAILRGYHSDFTELLINIFDIVLLAAVGSVLLRKPASSADLTKSDLTSLSRLLKTLPSFALRKTLQNAATQVCRELQFTNPSQMLYIRSAAERMQPTIETAIETEILSTVFSIRKKPQRAKHTFNDYPNMNDKQFRALIEEIRNCRTSQSKAEIIREEIHSLADLVDILGASFITPKEYPNVFASLSEESLALLWRVAEPSSDNIHLTESEKEWHSALLRYMHCLSKEKQHHLSSIANLLNKIDIT